VLKTATLMPNKPWLIDRKFSLLRFTQIFSWMFFRTLNRLINKIPLEINIQNRIINHKYFLQNSNWKYKKGESVFGYFGLFLNNKGLKNECRNLMVSRPADFPIFFDRPLVADGTFYVHTSNNPYNYFHFMYDFIFPLFILRLENPRVQVYLPFSLAKWQVEWLKIIGQNEYISAEKNGNFTATNVFKFNSFLDSNNKILRVSEFHVFKEYLLGLVKLQDMSNLKGKIYIERKKSSMGRNVTNQSSIKMDLIELGFTIVDLDRLTVIQQITLFNNATVIISPHDAGLSNLITARADTKVIELLPTQEIGKYDMYKNICDINSINYSKVLSINHEKYLIGKDFAIDFRNLLNKINS
jgi:capsular polysaccharide biosynthesis protein